MEENLGAQAIVARNASKMFLDGAVVAFRQLDLRVRDKEILCIVGPSGCGKTTFLRCIAGLTDLTGGELVVGGRPVAGPPEGVAMVFQHFGLLPWKTVYDNAAFGLAMQHAPAARIKERVGHYLELVGLAGFERHYPYQLSGGMQQRVALCRALIHRPRLLLMDEPFGALDELTRMEMNDLLLRIRHETKASVLFVTHSISEAVYLSDKVIVFSKRPARVAQEIPIPLAYPRSQRVRFTAAFTTAERTASEALGVIATAPEEVPAP